MSERVAALSLRVADGRGAEDFSVRISSIGRSRKPPAFYNDSAITSSKRLPIYLKEQKERLVEHPKRKGRSLDRPGVRNKEKL